MSCTYLGILDFSESKENPSQERSLPHHEKSVKST